MDHATPRLNTITWEQQVGHILRLVTFKITLNATGKKTKNTGKQSIGNTIELQLQKCYLSNL